MCGGEEGERGGKERDEDGRREREEEQRERERESESMDRGAGRKSGWREGEKRGRKRKSRIEEREENGSRGRRQGQNFTMTIILCFQVMNKHRYSHTMYELLLSRLIHVSYMSTNIHFIFTRMEVLIRDKGNLKVLKDSRGELVSEYQLPQYQNNVNSLNINFAKKFNLPRFHE